MYGLGFRVHKLGFLVKGDLLLEVKGRARPLRRSVLPPPGAQCCECALGFRAWGVGLRVKGVGSRVKG